MSMGYNERIAELKAEIRRLEAEEYAANAGKRLEDFCEAVSKTGYFRERQAFYKAKDGARGWLDDGDMYKCEASREISLWVLNDGGVNVDVELPHIYSTLTPEDVVPISAAEYEAVKVLLASVRSQVSSFINQYCKDDGQR